MRGSRIFLVALLLTFPFAGMGAADDVCVEQPPVLFCVDVPPVPTVEPPALPDFANVTIGEARFVDGTSSAVAYNTEAYALSTSTTLRVPYEIVHGTPAPGTFIAYEVRTYAWLMLPDGTSRGVGDSYAWSEDPGPRNVTGVLTMTLSPDDIEAGNVYTHVELTVWLSGQQGRLLGRPVSNGEILFVSVPPAERFATADVRPGTPLEVATFTASAANGITIDMTQGATFVSQGPARLVARGNVTTLGMNGLYQSWQGAYAWMRVSTPDGTWSVGRDVHYEWCYGTCSLTGEQHDVTLDLVLPARLTHPHAVIRTSVGVEMHAEANYAQLYVQEAQGNGENVVYVVGL